jgi:hypothetical protein
VHVLYVYPSKFNGDKGFAIYQQAQVGTKAVTVGNIWIRNATLIGWCVAVAEHQSE